MSLRGNLNEIEMQKGAALKRGKANTKANKNMENSRKKCLQGKGQNNCFEMLPKEVSSCQLAY